jgi:hypothetical protein
MEKKSLLDKSLEINPFDEPTDEQIEHIESRRPKLEKLLSEANGKNGFSHEGFLLKKEMLLFLQELKKKGLEVSWDEHVVLTYSQKRE